MKRMVDLPSPPSEAENTDGILIPSPIITHTYALTPEPFLPTLIFQKPFRYLPQHLIQNHPNRNQHDIIAMAQSQVVEQMQRLRTWLEQRKGHGVDQMQVEYQVCAELERIDEMRYRIQNELLSQIKDSEPTQQTSIHRHQRKSVSSTEEQSYRVKKHDKRKGHSRIKMQRERQTQVEKALEARISNTASSAKTIPSVEQPRLVNASTRSQTPTERRLQGITLDPSLASESRLISPTLSTHWPPNPMLDTQQLLNTAMRIENKSGLQSDYANALDMHAEMEGIFTSKQAKGSTPQPQRIECTPPKDVVSSPYAGLVAEVPNLTRSATQTRGAGAGAFACQAPISELMRDYPFLQCLGKDVQDRWIGFLAWFGHSQRVRNAILGVVETVGMGRCHWDWDGWSARFLDILLARLRELVAVDTENGIAYVWKDEMLFARHGSKT